MLLCCILILLLPASNVFAQPRTIRVVHTNDVGGDLAEDGSSGGLGRVVAAVNKLRQEHPALVLDAGNILGPDVISSWDGGQAAVEALNRKACRHDR